jgi:hypothetical protein
MTRRRRRDQIVVDNNKADLICDGAAGAWHARIWGPSSVFGKDLSTIQQKAADVAECRRRISDLTKADISAQGHRNAARIKILAQMAKKRRRAKERAEFHGGNVPAL